MLLLLGIDEYANRQTPTDWGIKQATQKD